MATLTGNAINTSYQGLIKFDDNGAVDPTTLKQITDGTGGSLPIQVSQVQTKFQSLVDFTDATVSGLPVAVAGLEVGTGTNSLVNAVGGASTASGVNSIAIGNACNTNQEAGIALGDRAAATGYGSFAAGLFAQAAGFGGFALGQYAESSQGYGAAFGPSARSTAESGIAFGQQTLSSHTGAIAMGRQVETINADTTHVRALYVVAPDGGTGGNGITMLSPNGTAGVITLTDASELAVDGTPIGGGGGAGLVAGTGTDSMKSADTLTTTPNVASGANSIAIGDALVNDTPDAISIGRNISNTGQGDGIIIGRDHNHTYGRDCVVIGNGQDSPFSIGQDNVISIGRTGRNDADAGICIGKGTATTGATASGAIAIGQNAKGGLGAADSAVAIGQNAQAQATRSVALGANITAATVDTVTLQLLQIAGYATMNFADDTAAATGGIPLGGVYHTDGALKIRIA